MRTEVTQPISPALVRWFSILPSEVCYKDLASISDIKDLYGAIRGTGSESSTVVVHLGIVLKHTDINTFNWQYVTFYVD